MPRHGSVVVVIVLILVFPFVALGWFEPAEVVVLSMSAAAAISAVVGPIIEVA
jgi:hypothetical protein